MYKNREQWRKFSSICAYQTQSTIDNANFEQRSASKRYLTNDVWPTSWIPSHQKTQIAPCPVQTLTHIIDL